MEYKYKYHYYRHNQGMYHRNAFFQFIIFQYEILFWSLSAGNFNIIGRKHYKQRCTKSDGKSEIIE